MVTVPRSFHSLARQAPVDLPPRAQERLCLLSVWQTLRAKGWTGQEAAQALGVSRATLYRWQQRLRQYGLRGLEERSRRPRRCRRRAWPVTLVQAVQRLREQYPRWGKAKLVVLLRRAGFATSASTVGRILASLQARGVLREPVRAYRTSKAAPAGSSLWGA